MTLSSETVVEVDRWRIKKLFKDGEFSHYVLNVPMDRGHATNPFVNVKASGGLLSLRRDNNTSVTFTGVIDGLNTYREDADMPKRVFDELKQIGPY